MTELYSNITGQLLEKTRFLKWLIVLLQCVLKNFKKCLWEAGTVLKMDLSHCILQLFDGISTNGDLRIVCSVLVCLMGISLTAHVTILLFKFWKRGLGTKILRW